MQGQTNGWNKNVIYRTRANKGHGFYSKIFFQPCTNSKFCLFLLHAITQNSKNAPIIYLVIFGCGYYSRVSVIGAGTVGGKWLELIQITQYLDGFQRVSFINA